MAVSDACAECLRWRTGSGKPMAVHACRCGRMLCFRCLRLRYLGGSALDIVDLWPHLCKRLLKSESPG